LRSGFGDISTGGDGGARRGEVSLSIPLLLLHHYLHQIPHRVQRQRKRKRKKKTPTTTRTPRKSARGNLALAF